MSAGAIRPSHRRVLRAAGRTLNSMAISKSLVSPSMRMTKPCPSFPKARRPIPSASPEQKFNSPPAATPKPRWSSDWKKKNRTPLNLRVHHLGHPGSQLRRTGWQELPRDGHWGSCHRCHDGIVPQPHEPRLHERMEDELDLVAGGDKNWRDMLGEFYGRFSNSLEKPRINPTSGRLKPAKWSVPRMRRHHRLPLGQERKILTCTCYPDCKWACPSTRRQSHRARTSGHRVP